MINYRWLAPLIAGTTHRLRIRSIVGIIPLFAVEVLDEELLQQPPGFRKRSVP